MKDQKNNFVNSINVKSSQLDFVVCQMNIKVAELQEFLRSKEDFAKDNNGFITIDVLRAKKDRNKIYCKFSEWKPQKQVTSQEHMPDRDTADVPF